MNEKTQETKTIVTLNDITAVELSSEQPNLLTIKLPNPVDISNATMQLGDVRSPKELGLFPIRFARSRLACTGRGLTI